MKLGLVACVLMIAFSAEARKPAVEDFVGIEPETQETIPSGTESLYNFSQEVKDYQKDGPRQAVVRYTKQQPSMDAPGATGGSFSLFFGIAFVLALPMITWLVMNRHLQARDEAAATTATNVADLAARRAEKQAQSAEVEKSDVKKAS